MNDAQRVARETAEDVFFGQVVIIWARWFLIFAAAALTIWSARTSTELVTNMLAVIGLMAINFFLHGRFFLRRPANATLLTAMSLLDLGIITAIVLVWQQTGGLTSPYFVFYYPVVFAFALVFPARWSVPYTVLALIAYSLVCLLAQPSLVAHASDLKLLCMRLITLAAMGGLGTYFWRIQRAHRRQQTAGEPAGLGAPASASETR